MAKWAYQRVCMRRNLLRNSLILALFCLFFYYISYKHVSVTKHKNVASIRRERPKPVKKPHPEGNQVHTRKRVILFYTNLWQSRTWNGFETTEKFNNWGGVPCKEQNCAVTYDRSMISKADVVVFHGFDVDMLSEMEIKELSKQRHSNQVWIYFMHESPFHALPKPERYNGYFNWTMNYKQDADITVPYNWEWGTWEEIPATEQRNAPKDHSLGKDKLVYAIISNCGLLRDKYIKKLQEYIPVDVYGKCSGQFHATPKVCKRNSKDCTELRKHYKFFLAFENSFCLDYITEKFHGTILDGDAVPVVMGGADYDRLAIRKSYINVYDFESVEGLAKYLKFLDQNNDAYNGYQKWRENYKLGKPRSWSCEICRMANEPKILRKTYGDLGAWYSVKNNCENGVKKLKNIMINSNIPGPYIDQYNY